MKNLSRNYHDMLESEVFTSCFNPNCAGISEQMQMPFVSKSDRRERKKRSKSRDRKQMKKDEISQVRKHVAAAHTRRTDSLLTRDDETETLLTEVELTRSGGSSETEPSTDFSGTFDSSSETRDLNTLPDDDNETRYRQAKVMLARMSGSGAPLCTGLDTTNSATAYGHVVSPTNSAGKFDSIRSKFDHMRLHKQFANSIHPPGQDPPCDKSLHSFKSLKADESMNFMRVEIKQRRNELAKQIMKRRQNTPAPISRTGVDP